MDSVGGGLDRHRDQHERSVADDDGPVRRVILDRRTDEGGRTTIVIECVLSGQTQGSVQEEITDEDVPAGRVILDGPGQEDGRYSWCLGRHKDQHMRRSLIKMPWSVKLF